MTFKGGQQITLGREVILYLIGQLAGEHSQGCSPLPLSIPCVLAQRPAGWSKLLGLRHGLQEPAAVWGGRGRSHAAMRLRWAAGACWPLMCSNRGLLAALKTYLGSACCLELGPLLWRHAWNVYRTTKRDAQPNPDAPLPPALQTWQSSRMKSICSGQ